MKRKRRTALTHTTDERNEEQTAGEVGPAAVAGTSDRGEAGFSLHPYGQQRKGETAAVVFAG